MKLEIIKNNNGIELDNSSVFEQVKTSQGVLHQNMVPQQNCRAERDMSTIIEAVLLCERAAFVVWVETAQLVVFVLNRIRNAIMIQKALSKFIMLNKLIFLIFMFLEKFKLKKKYLFPM